MSEDKASDIIPEPERKLVDDAVAKLLEHFSSVKIFVTRHDGHPPGPIRQKPRHPQGRPGP